jgi:hypothetical protein
MTRYQFGEVEDDDVLIIQGREYKMQPIGMAVTRRMLGVLKMGDDNAEGRTEATIDYVLANVVPEQRDELRQHIDDSVGAKLLAQIVTGLVGSQADVDPTQPPSPSTGSTATGRGSTDGAVPVASTQQA